MVNSLKTFIMNIVDSKYIREIDRKYSKKIVVCKKWVGIQSEI